jgi:LysM repeat protein
MRERLTGTLTRITEFVQTNLYTILAVLLVVVLTAAYIFFYVSTLDPGLTNRTRLETQLDESRRTLLNARSVQADPVESWQTRVADARATLATSQNAFLVSEQSTQTIDVLYQYARASGVTITELQVPPTPTPLPTPTWTPTRLPTPLPTATSLTRSATTPQSPAQPASTQPVPPTTAPPQANPVQSQAAPYYIRAIRLRAQGTARQLVDFTSRLKETNTKGIVVNSFNIVGNDETPNAFLNMDLSLYVLSSSSDAVAPRAPTPLPAPPVYVYPTPVIPVVIPSATLGVMTVTITPIPIFSLTPTPSLTPTATSKYIVHTVQAGDTLFSLARRYGTTVEAIMALNRLSNSNIRVGQQLQIPVP